MLSEMRQSQKDKHWMIHLSSGPRGVRFIVTESKTVGARGWGKRVRSEYLAGTVSVWGDGNALEMMVVMATQECKCTECH